jgi:hypothetical protein
MLSHKIGIFAMTGNVIILGEYSDQECVAYLKKFMNVSFEFDGNVQSIGFQLQAPHQNRLANIYLYSLPADKVTEMNNQRRKIEPMGIFQLKLSHNGSTDIWPLI